jgi:Fe-Mn family superoxide dismutase
MPYQLYEPRDFENLLYIGHLSRELMKDHLSLYRGYVNNTDKLLQELDLFSKEDIDETPEYAELKRRLGWEFNGMRLHEYYFSNMIKGGSILDRNTNLFKKITQNFGSYDNWEKDFKATGMMRGIGWVILIFDPLSGRLFNTWIDEHNSGHFTGCYPILVLDVFEHAYLLDYGIKKSDYIDTFFKIIKWTISPELDAVLGQY